MKDLFLPPGVQCQMFAVYGKCPRQAPENIVEKINKLWLEQNNCPESEIERLDQTMFAVASEVICLMQEPRIDFPATSEISKISHFISGYHPPRPLDPMERRDEGNDMFVVKFPRGFEALQVAVFGDGLTTADAEEAAVEYLRAHHPDSLTEAEEAATEKGVGATQVAKLPNPYAPAQDVKTGESIPISETAIQTWFERDRKHVALLDATTEQQTFVQWWDTDVDEAIEDGFLDPRNYHASAYKYARDRQMLPERVSHNRALVEVGSGIPGNGRSLGIRGCNPHWHPSIRS